LYENTGLLSSVPKRAREWEESASDGDSVTVLVVVWGYACHKQ